MDSSDGTPSEFDCYATNRPLTAWWDITRIQSVSVRLDPAQVKTIRSRTIGNFDSVDETFSDEVWETLATDIHEEIG